MKDLKIIASDRDLICLAFVNVCVCACVAFVSIPESFPRWKSFPGRKSCLLLVEVCAQLSFLISDRIIILTGIVNL